MLSQVAFWMGLSAAMAVAGLSVLTFVKKDFEFWPPPNLASWQHRTFRGLFRVFFAALVVLSIADFDGASGSPWRYGVGGALFVVGFGLALRWTGRLGWRNAFGEAKGLKTEGPFAWSRNPIYVVSIVGMIGWGLIVDSSYLTILLFLWAALYVGAPFLEEPWLEKKYGDDFRQYKGRVPRFFGLRG